MCVDVDACMFGAWQFVINGKILLRGRKKKKKMREKKKWAIN